MPSIFTRSLASLAALALSAGAALARDEAVITRLNPDTMPQTLQYGYSQVAVAAAGARLVFVAGQVGRVEAGANDFRAQVDRSFDRLAAGATPRDVVQITLLIVDHEPEKLAYLVSKRKAFFGDAAPSSVLIPVTELYADGVSFEISAVAALPARP